MTPYVALPTAKPVAPPRRSPWPDARWPAASTTDRTTGRRPRPEHEPRPHVGTAEPLVGRIEGRQRTSWPSPQRLDAMTADRYVAPRVRRMCPARRSVATRALVGRPAAGPADRAAVRRGRDRWRRWPPATSSTIWSCPDGSTSARIWRAPRLPSARPLAAGATLDDLGLRPDRVPGGLTARRHQRAPASPP